MRLEQLQLENFGGFASLSLRFDPQLTILVGVNGSGKTTVLKAVTNALRFALIEEALTSNRDTLRNETRKGGIELFGHTGDTALAVRLHMAGDVATGASESLRSILAAKDVVPISSLYPVDRRAHDRTPAITEPTNYGPTSAWEGALDTTVDFDALFRWFREREDVENEAVRSEPTYVDPQLDAVRRAVEHLVPGFRKLRVRRPRNDGSETGPFRRPTLVVEKNDTLLAFGQLSEGERLLIAMVADIARRLAIANPGRDPLTGTGVVMIDEVDLHLHPKWQVEVLPALLRTFPELQFVVTTHSPLVLSRVRARCIRLLRDFKVYEPEVPTEGRDPSAILSEIFETSARPQDVNDKLHRIAELIDQEDLDTAGREIDELAERLGELDSEVVRLRSFMALLAS